MLSSERGCPFWGSEPLTVQSWRGEQPARPLPGRCGLGRQGTPWYPWNRGFPRYFSRGAEKDFLAKKLTQTVGPPDPLLPGDRRAGGLPWAVFKRKYPGPSRSPQRSALSPAKDGAPGGAADAAGGRPGRPGAGTGVRGWFPGSPRVSLPLNTQRGGGVWGKHRGPVSHDRGSDWRPKQVVCSASAWGASNWGAGHLLPRIPPP